jgi:amino-acid N-acetyltransferase
MSARFEIRPARPADLPAVLALLGQSGLPVDDLREGLPALFFIAEDGGTIVAGGGIERLGEYGLLRSLAVAGSLRGSGLGRHLVECCEAAARTAGLDTLYLLTTSADAFFAHLGYEVVARDRVPASVTAHAQFRSLCPASAKCLRKNLAVE